MSSRAHFFCWFLGTAAPPVSRECFHVTPRFSLLVFYLKAGVLLCVRGVRHNTLKPYLSLCNGTSLIFTAGCGSMIPGSLAIISFLVSKRRIEDSAKLFWARFGWVVSKTLCGLKHWSTDTYTHTYTQTHQYSHNGTNPEPITAAMISPSANTKLQPSTTSQSETTRCKTS